MERLEVQGVDILLLLSWIEYPNNISKLLYYIHFVYCVTNRVSYVIFHCKMIIKMNYLRITIDDIWFETWFVTYF